LKQFLYQQNAATQPAAIAFTTIGKDIQRIQSMDRAASTAATAATAAATATGGISNWTAAKGPFAC